MRVLTVNAGSSSLKLSLLGPDDAFEEQSEVEDRGQIFPNPTRSTFGAAPGPR